MRGSWILDLMMRSRLDRATLASPSAKRHIDSIKSESTDSWCGSLSISIARLTIALRSSIVCRFNWINLHLDKSGIVNLNDGFSVVAKIMTTRPDSRCGKNRSCWDLFNLWTSSTNTRGIGEADGDDRWAGLKFKVLLLLAWPDAPYFLLLWSTIFFQSAIENSVPGNSKYSYLRWWGGWWRSRPNNKFFRHLARVVLPEPDGPHKIKEWPLLINVCRVDLRCGGPWKSSIDCGLTLWARGCLKVEVDGDGREEVGFSCRGFFLEVRLKGDDGLRSWEGEDGWIGWSSWLWRFLWSVLLLVERGAILDGRLSEPGFDSVERAESSGISNEFRVGWDLEAVKDELKWFWSRCWLICSDEIEVEQIGHSNQEPFLYRSPT